MNKKLIFTAIPIIIILILIFAFFSITGSKTVKAQLHATQPGITLNGEEVTGNLKLKQGDIIQTKDAVATVILHESVIVNLGPNTKITVADLAADHPKLEQEGGKTWNKFTKLIGVEQYTISEGNSVASVRGTFFEFSEGKVLVSEGEVQVTINGKTYSVTAGKVVEKIQTVDENGNPTEEIVEREVTQEESAEVKEQISKSIEELKYLRDLEIEKHPTTVNTYKSMYDVTDADIKQALVDADNGEVDIDEAYEQSPVKIESVKRIADITKTIQEMNKQR